MAKETKEANVSKADKFQKGVGIASGALGAATSLLSNFEGGEEIEAQADAQVNQVQNQMSKSSLSNWVADWIPQSTESMGLAGVSGALSGAAAGAAAGPWGALAGGVAGLAGGLFGAGDRNGRRRRANERVQEALSVQNSYLTQKETQDALANIVAFGGWVNTHGGDYPTGFNEFNEGDSHERNINGGVPQGIDSNGVPNLVEEGETKWDDYIFSKRLKIPKGFSKAYDLGNVDKRSYADASKSLSKESKERPFDPISKKGRDAMLSRLQQAQEAQKYIDKADEAMNEIFDLNEISDLLYAEGGGIHIKPSKRGTFTAAAKKHGKGVQEFARQVLANKENYSSAMVKKANFARNASKWHAAGGRLLAEGNYLYKSNWMTPVGDRYSAGSAYDVGPRVGYNPIGRVGMRVPTYDYDSQPTINSRNRSTESIASGTLLNNFNNRIVGNTSVPTDTSFIDVEDNSEGPKKPKKKNFWLESLGLFAPALTNTGLAISDAFSTPEEVSYGQMDLSPYMTRRRLPYEPIDREYMANKYRAQANATARNIINTSAGNPASARAALVAHNYNALNALGDMYIKSDEINRQRKKESIMFDAEQDRQLAALAAQQQQFNIMNNINEQQINAQNRAAARNSRRSGISQIGQSIGEASRYLGDIRRINNMFDYNQFGEWLDKYNASKNATGGFLFDPEVAEFLRGIKKGGK
jgi:hypothetical protein